MRCARPVVSCLLAAAALVSTGAVAQTPPPTEASTAQLKPYLQVKPVAGDTDVVRVFFSPACPYSRNYLPFFTNLQSTLPQGKTLEFTPLVNKGDGLSYALAFTAVRMYYPAYVHNFVEASMVGVQDLGLSTRNWAGVDRIGRAARVPTSIAQLVHEHWPDVSRDLARTLAKQKAFGVTNTPAVAVAGTYIVTPEFTNGDPMMFSQLVNGIISMP
jgi:protein-disulfide isomerase